MIKNFIYLFVLVLATNIKAGTYDITKYGAVGDEKTLNTAFIQKAIDDCSKSGGGNVILPKGKYLTGTILMKDNVTLEFRDSAVLVGSQVADHYLMVDSFRSGNNALMGYAFIAAVDVKNIGFIGKGTIDGRGHGLLEKNGKKKRPFLMRFVRTKGITLQGIHLTNSACWTAHFFACTNVTIDSVSIFSRGLSNNDGIDLDCTQDVKITNTNIDSGDDAICFKTTWSGMATKNIEINNVKLSSNHGAIKSGTESMAPFENIKITNVYIYNSGGIKLHTVDGARMRNIEISDVVMENVKTPLWFRLGARLNVFRKGADVQQPVGLMENVVVRNVKAKSAKKVQLTPATGIVISGIPGHYIKNLTLENIQISLPGGGTNEDARHVVPENENKYPEVNMFGTKLPAYGVFARHVTGLKLKNVSFILDSADLRPAFIIQDGKNIDIADAKLPMSSGQSVIRIDNVVNAMVSNISVSGNAEALVRIEGAESRKINVLNNCSSAIKKIVDLSSEVQANTVNIK